MAATRRVAAVTAGTDEIEIRPDAPVPAALPLPRDSYRMVNRTGRADAGLRPIESSQATRSSPSGVIISTAGTMRA
jgi:hypothetical protein